MELSTKEQVHLLRERFIHRLDAYAIQQLDRETGDVWFRKATKGFCNHEPRCDPKYTCPNIENKLLTPTDVERHILGTQTLGVYQLDGDSAVRWLCLDVDIDKDAPLPPEEAQTRVREHTRALARTLQAFRLPFLVESSGSRGYHLWVFFSEPVPAGKVLTLGYFLDGAVQASEGIHVEVFPKQAKRLRDGNLVKLPLGIHRKTGARTAFVGGSFTPLPDQWKALRDVKCLSYTDLIDFLAENEVDEVETAQVEYSVGSAGKVSLPCHVAMLQQGVRQGQRDVASFRLACGLRAWGLPYEVALAALRDWNERNNPPMNDESLRVRVGSAYRANYAYFPCQERALDEYCTSACQFYANKMKRRQGRG